MEGRKQSARIRPGSIEPSKIPATSASWKACGRSRCRPWPLWRPHLAALSPSSESPRGGAGTEGTLPGGAWQGLLYSQVGFSLEPSKTPAASPLRETGDSVPRRTEDGFGAGGGGRSSSISRSKWKPRRRNCSPRLRSGGLPRGGPCQALLLLLLWSRL